MRITETHIAHLRSLETQGRQTVDAVLADARRPESPLHDLYDWNVQEAAEAHWRDRTRQIIRQVQVVVHTETRTIKIPQYVKDPTRSGREQGVLSIDYLRVDATLARRALIVELERVTSALRRARNVALGLDLEGEVDRLLDVVAGLRVTMAQAASGVEATSGAEAAPPPA